MGSGGNTLRVLHLDVRWRWVVSFTARLLYVWGRACGICWVEDWLRRGEERSRFPLPEINPDSSAAQPIA
jgi:hypothetical protein